MAEHDDGGRSESTQTESKPHNCPMCGGSGNTGPVHVNRGPDQPGYWLENDDCRVCGGAGAVSDAFLRRYHAGLAAKERRILRRESVGEAADRLGISPADLSGIEHGRDPKSATAKQLQERWLVAEPTDT